MDEDARDRDHAWVRVPSILHFWHSGLLVTKNVVGMIGTKAGLIIQMRV